MSVSGARLRSFSQMRALYVADSDGLANALAVAAIFGVVAYLSGAFTQNTDGVATIWPANGIVLAAVIPARHRWRRHQILALTFLANVIANFFAHRGLATNIGFALTNTIEIYTAFHILKIREREPYEFRNVHFLISFLIAAVVGSTIASVAAAIVTTLTIGTITWHVFT